MVKKTRPSAQDVIAQMYPDLPTSDDFEVKKEETKDEASKQIAALQAQIAQLEGKLSVTTQPSVKTAQAPIPPTAPVLNYEAAPDPAVNPKEFAKFVAEQTQKQIAYEKELYNYQQQQASVANGRVSALWNDFSTQYKDYAADQERVSIAATNVVNKAKAAGLDTEQYMYGTSKKFMEDVTKEIDRLWPKSAAGDDDVDDDDDDGEDNRTQFASPVPQSGKRQSREEPVSQFGALGKEIIEWQQQTGFHR